MGRRKTSFVVLRLLIIWGVDGGDYCVGRMLRGTVWKIYFLGMDWLGSHCVRRDLSKLVDEGLGLRSKPGWFAVGESYFLESIQVKRID